MLFIILFPTEVIHKNQFKYAINTGIYTLIICKHFNRLIFYDILENVILLYCFIWELEICLQAIICKSLICFLQSVWEEMPAKP